MTYSTIKTMTTKKAIEELHYMLTFMRPAGSPTEKKFVETFVDDLPQVSSDGYGNRHVVIGDTNVIWSSHTDSVHHHAGRQIVIKRDGAFRLKPGQTNKPSCLGADCATGVWIMRHMILRGIPGHYIFHRDEECGGLGSSWVAKNEPGLIEHAQIAIAFDRKGYDSVITHQGCRTASDAFARSAAALLGGKYAPDSGGIFTDTAKYASLIPECTNFSVGYHSAHSSDEWQDFEFAGELLDRMCSFDVSQLVVSRDPAVTEYKSYAGYGSYSSNYSGGRSLVGLGHWTDHYGDDWDGLGHYTADTKHRIGTSSRTNFSDLYEMVRDYPVEIATWLDENGVDAEELMDMILTAHGRR